MQAFDDRVDIEYLEKTTNLNNLHIYKVRPKTL